VVPRSIPSAYMPITPDPVEAVTAGVAPIGP
jgi:hypothetical protein